MRIRIAHATTHTYDEPVRAITQLMRLSPRDSDSQQVANWRISLSTDGRMHTEEDGFGNFVQRFETDGPLQEMTITVDGTVDTFDTAGILRGNFERVPPDVFLRDTELTTADEALIAFAETTTANSATTLDKLHALLDTLHETLTLKPDHPEAALAATQTYAAREGRPRDMAHVFVVAARHLEIPARIVTGYSAPVDGSETANTIHCWSEAYADGYGWIGFDVAQGLCPTISHVRLACGLDYADVTPIRGARKGGGREAMTVMVHISGQQ